MFEGPNKPPAAPLDDGPDEERADLEGGEGEPTAAFEEVREVVADVGDENIEADAADLQKTIDELTSELEGVGDLAAEPESAEANPEQVEALESAQNTLERAAGGIDDALVGYSHETRRTVTASIMAAVVALGALNVSMPNEAYADTPRDKVNEQVDEVRDVLKEREERLREAARNAGATERDVRQIQQGLNRLLDRFGIK